MNWSTRGFFKVLNRRETEFDNFKAFLFHPFYLRLMKEPLFFNFNFFCSEQKDLAEPDGKKPSQKRLKKTLPKKKSWYPAVSTPDPNLELCKVMHSFQKSLDANCKAQTPLKTDNSDTHYCLSLADRMSGLYNKTKAYVLHSIEKFLFDIESGAYATVVPATQYHATPYFNSAQFHPVQQSQSFSQNLSHHLN